VFGDRQVHVFYFKILRSIRISLCSEFFLAIIVSSNSFIRFMLKVIILIENIVVFYCASELNLPILGILFT